MKIFFSDTLYDLSESVELTGKNDLEDILYQCHKNESLDITSDEADNYKVVYTYSQPSLQSFVTGDLIVSTKTSGSTGQSKVFSHKMRDFFSKINLNNKFKGFVTNYNPKTTAGLQVLFQALATDSDVYFVDTNTPSKLFNQFLDNSSNCSFSVSFARLIPNDITSNSVQKVLLGGEAFDIRVAKYMKQRMPNAQINSVYAASEFGSAFLSDEEGVFRLSKESGKVVLEGEKLKFKNKEGQYVDIGDVCEIVEEDEQTIAFRIIGREKNTVNIGGLKANLEELENKIIEVTGVLDCQLFSKKNSILGNILTLEVVPQADFEMGLCKEKINAEIQKEFRPMKIKVTDAIAYNLSGKKIRSNE